MTNYTKQRNNEKLTLRSGLIIMMILVISNLSWANNSQSIFDLMHHQEVLNVTLETNLTFLKENRRSTEYQPARVQFLDENKNEQNWNLKVRLRGNFRRMNCTDIPPLKWKFKKADLEKAGLNTFNDMKMVTTCIQDKEAAKTALMKEYLTYKLYNSITEKSFRVQLMRITYKDLHTGRKSKSWGFLIEDTAQLRNRLSAEKCEDCFGGFSPSDYDYQALKSTAVFQYIIGNADWDINASKNIKLVRKNGKLIPIPYDFDFSGLVDAPYAIPNPDYELTSVQERVYLGFPEDLGFLHSTLQHFHGQRTDLKCIIRNFKYLNYSVRIAMTDYLDTFFENFENIDIKKKNVQIMTVTP